VRRSTHHFSAEVLLSEMTAMGSVVFTDMMAVFRGADLCRMRHFTPDCETLTVLWQACALATYFHLLPPSLVTDLAWLTVM
jgi:hypothetical protein